MSKSAEEMMLEEYKAKKAKEAAEAQRRQQVLQGVIDFAKKDREEATKSAAEQRRYFSEN
ncbi:hypothetical protein [Paenibacillus sp. y28]|uniref:hypothetical protein n=1 Tax=Paenibacillus sp. y28 TaxID=3129110 RepID=UPI00301B0718